MPMYDIQCTSGHTQLDVLCKIDEHPKCDQCGEPTHRVWISRKSQVIGDEIPGGIWLENYGPEPIQVFSHSERLRIMAQPRIDHEGNEYRLTEMVRHVDVPGVGKSPHTSDWGNRIDPITMENARVLVSRGSRPSNAPLTEFDEGYNDPDFRTDAHRANEINDVATPAEVRGIVEAMNRDN